MSGIEVVLFDLGGVLVELRGPPAFGGSGDDEDAIWKRWLACPWVRRFERGQCTAAAFAEGLVADWGLAVSPTEFLDRFARWPVGLYPGAAELLKQLGTRLRCACFSNTNALHWNDAFRRFELVDLFDRHFLSFEMGLVKPDAVAFAHVARELGGNAEAILFLDDNQVNVDAARAAGFSAERVRGPEEARTHIRAYTEGAGIL